MRPGSPSARDSVHRRSREREVEHPRRRSRSRSKDRKRRDNHRDRERDRGDERGRVRRSASSERGRDRSYRRHSRREEDEEESEKEDRRSKESHEEGDTEPEEGTVADVSKYASHGEACPDEDAQHLLALREKKGKRSSSSSSSSSGQDAETGLGLAAPHDGEEDDSRGESKEEGAAPERDGEEGEEDDDSDGLVETMRWKFVFPSADELKFALGPLEQLYTEVFAKMVFDKVSNRAVLSISQLNQSRTALNVHTVPCTVYVAPGLNEVPKFRVPLQSLMRAIDSARNETPVHMFVENDPRNNLTVNDLVVVVPAAEAREQDTTVIRMLEWNGSAPTVNKMKPNYVVTMPISRLLNALRVEKSKIKFTVLGKDGEQRLVFRIETGNEKTVKRKEVMHDPMLDLDEEGKASGTRTAQTEPLGINRFRAEAGSMEALFEAEYPGTIIAKFLSTPHLRPQTPITVRLFNGEPLLLEASSGGAVVKLLVPPLIPQDEE